MSLLNQERKQNLYLERCRWKVTSEHLAASARHASVHKLMLPNVRKRAADLVDAALLRSTLSYHQCDLELIDVNHVNVSNEEFVAASKVRDDTSSLLYIMIKEYKVNATVFAKAYNDRINLGNIEYRIIHHLHSRGTCNVPKPVGICVNKLYTQCLLTESMLSLSLSSEYWFVTMVWVDNMSIKGVPWGQGDVYGICLILVLDGNVWWLEICHYLNQIVDILMFWFPIKGALDNFSLIPNFFSKKLRFLYH